MTIEINKKPGANELMSLFFQTSWAKDRDPKRVEKMLETDQLSVCIRIEGKLIAYGRILTDGCFRGLLDDIVVDEFLRGKGYGGLLVKELIKLAENIDVLFLNADPEMESFYSRYGFRKFGGLTMKLSKDKIETDQD